jgi:hypothetical protein
MRAARIATLLGTILIGLLAESVVAQPAQCPSPAPIRPGVTISPTLPLDACVPSGFGGLPIDFFDDFSWRSFVALVWPAAAGQRGVADTGRSVGATDGPLVFETYKSDWEIFQPGGAAPTPWNSNTPSSPCPNVPSVGFGDLVLASFSKFGNVGQAGTGDLVGPIVAQNGTYVRYLAAVNKVEFDQIHGNKWYLRSNLKGITFAPDTSKNNPIDIKSSWIVVRNGKPDGARYYTRKAWVFDPETQQCARETVALVGLHIVTKTPSRPQWIWSSFEHIDNVPDGAARPLAFNDGSGAAMPARNPIPFPPPDAPPAPFNIERIKAIASQTRATNSAYQAELARRGVGVWRFYQLVMTQWPVPGDAPANPGSPDFTFPGRGANTAFSNTTMETFDQNNIRQGCMACHDVVGTVRGADSTDFLWALAMNAFPSESGVTPNDPPLSQPQGIKAKRAPPSPSRSLGTAGLGRTSRAKTALSAQEGLLLNLRRHLEIGAGVVPAPAIRSYAELGKYVHDILEANKSLPVRKPHLEFWLSLSYEDFVNGNVPGVKDPKTNRPMKILEIGNSKASNLILALEGTKGTIFDPDGDFGPMPAIGPLFTPEQIAPIAAWIDAGCPK